MGTNKIKGIYRGFKYIIQIFVVKERKLEIGLPTDVKHVAHIGCDGTAGNPPSWMSGPKISPELSSSVKAYGGSPNNNGIPRDSSTNSMFFTPRASPDLNSSSTGYHHLPGTACTLEDAIRRSDNPSSKPKKQKRKKKTRSSALKGSSSLSKNLRSSSNTKFHELEPTVAILA